MAGALGSPPVCSHVEKNTFVDYSTGVRVSCTTVCHTEQPDITRECKDLCPDYYTCLTLLTLAKGLVTTSATLLPQLTPLVRTPGVRYKLYISSLVASLVCLITTTSLLFVWKCTKKYRKPEQSCIGVQSENTPLETAHWHLKNDTRMKTDESSLLNVPESGERGLSDNDTNMARVDVHISPSSARYHTVTETIQLLPTEAKQGTTQSYRNHHPRDWSVEEHLCTPIHIKHHNSPAVSLSSGLSASRYEQAVLNADDGLQQCGSYLTSSMGNHSVHSDHGTTGIMNLADNVPFPGMPNSVDQTDIPPFQGMPNLVDHTDTVPCEFDTSNMVNHTNTIPYEHDLPRVMDHADALPNEQITPSIMAHTDNFPYEHHTLVCHPTDSDQSYPYMFN